MPCVWRRRHDESQTLTRPARGVSVVRGSGARGAVPLVHGGDGAVVTYIHKYRVSWMQKRAEPRGTSLLDLFERRDVACCAVTTKQALQRAGVPANALCLNWTREGP